MSFTPPGPKRPMSVAEAEQQAVAQMNAAGPDVEELEDDTDVEYQFEEVEQPAPPAQTPPQAPVGEQPPPVVAKPAAPVGEHAPPPPAAPVEGQAPSDPWAEVEDVVYEDADTGKKYVVRAPKTYANDVKQGYQRRSYTDRKLSSLGKNKAWIEPLIENGQFDRLAPWMQQIFADPELQNGMADLLNRRQAGLPLRFMDAAASEAARAGQQQNAPPTPAAPAYRFDEGARRAELLQQGFDEYTAQAVMTAEKNAMAAYEAQAAPMRQQLADMQQRWDNQNRQAQTQQQQQARIQWVGATARNQLMSLYPDELNDRTPVETWNRIQQYAEQAGFVQHLGVEPGTFVVAYQRMREMGAQTNAPSAAVAQVAAIDAQARAQAAAAAQQVGRQVASGNGAPAGGPAPKQVVKVPRFRKDPRTGKLTPLTPVELAAWMKNNGAKA
jgi:hypothetical protein